ncbi:glycosyltransferase family 4 protein [Engelhardtia mirabilis]|uniref:Alpha-D-kanosaminyltransferase n=1 Tax=Engelhardtia mirabilis TaxID=2528011 RepID=A0A518BDF0_9BACT|nr:Alpha-D-kanosaminyltransferase [Planctomycetes bacterium Pla133]QDU99320.1 Alpha-D-kanosaminyltransferase [Planctomycetes bacterium Pla86]
MRVLITSPVFPPDLGGPAVYVPSLGRFLVERGHEVKVVAFCADDHPTGFPFEVTAIPRGPLPIRYLKAFFAVLREAKGQDVVYVQEHLALLHVLAAKLRGVPCVIRIMVDGAWEISHRKGWIDGDDINVFETKEYDWRVKLTRRLQRLWWSWTRNLICCSDFLRGICVERYGVPGEKAILIYNALHGLDPAAVTETSVEARTQLGLDPERRYLLTICRLMVWKGVDGIIRALEGLPEDVDLLVAGDGDMQAAWTALAAERGLGQRVHFLGNVPHAKIPLYIRASDVFVLNSEYEGLSHTLIEVTTLGTPAVCTGVCGNPEVVEHGVNGLLVPPKDDRALRDALARMLGDAALRERFARAGIERSSRFTRESTFPQVEAVLARAAGS